MSTTTDAIVFDGTNPVHTVSAVGGVSTVNGGNGRDIVITPGASDNGAGKHGGNLYLRAGAPLAPATEYGDVIIADRGEDTMIGGKVAFNNFGTWNNVNFYTGWRNANQTSGNEAYESLQWRRVGDCIQLRGACERNSGSSNNMFYLSYGAPAGRASQILVPGSTTGPARVNVSETGVYTLLSGSTSLVVFDGVFFYASAV